MLPIIMFLLISETVKNLQRRFFLNDADFIVVVVEQARGGNLGELGWERRKGGQLFIVKYGKG